MSERAHPEDKGFSKSTRLKVKLKKRILPFIYLEKNPFASEFRWRYKWASKFCREKNVLDVPCGMGWGTSLIRKAKKITGLDISSEAIEEAKHRYQQNNLFFLVGSMDKLPFDDLSFDIIVCLEGIEHVNVNVGKIFIQEADRTLVNGGLLLLSTPQHISRKHSGNPYHLYEYSPGEIINLTKELFDIKQVVSRKVSDLVVYYFVLQKR